MINSHFIGREPDPTPYMASSTTVSLAVCQFVELLRGERAVRVPANGFRVEAVRAEERYCLKCLDVRWFDVIYERSAFSGQPSVAKLKRCRGCGRESVVW
jgi:hypothetical protein